MGSKLNDATEKKIVLGGTAVELDPEKGIEFPPLSTQKYPIPISERALREYIARGGEILVIPAEKGGSELINSNSKNKQPQQDARD